MTKQKLSLATLPKQLLKVNKIQPHLMESNNCKGALKITRVETPSELTT